MPEDAEFARLTHDDGLVFVTAPRLELDQLLRQLVDRAEDVIAAQSRLGGLLAANKMIIADLDLQTVLRRIVEAACQLVHARYGALGVLAPGGGLEEFVHVGIADETAARIGPLPSGKGLLGALIKDPHPIRLQTMAEDIRSVGFPPNHPPMGSFLGVPIRVREIVFGNLYLTRADSREFTAEDEELVTALAATAGVAIENARLFAQSRRRQSWLRASTEITQQLLSTAGEEPLEIVARRMLEIADADIVTVVLPTPDGKSLMVEVAAGDRAGDLAGFSYPIENSLVGRAFETGRPILLADATLETEVYMHLHEATDVGAVMVVPLAGTTVTRGALAVGRLPGRHGFDEADLDMAKTFANHATIALELADARKDQQRMILLEDRDRIARDLHDHVIQRLFAAGLTLQGMATRTPDDDRADRLRAVVDGIDDTIRQIRTSIFQLRGELGPKTGNARTRLIETAAAVGETLGFEPRLSFSGPIDSLIPEPVLDDLVAVVREGLTNVAKHASATSAAVTLAVGSGELTLIVVDDGIGVGNPTRSSGLSNLSDRASRLGGTFTISPASPGVAEPHRQGTQLLWTIPLT